MSTAKQKILRVMEHDGEFYLIKLIRVPRYSKLLSSRQIKTTTTPHRNNNEAKHKSNSFWHTLYKYLKKRNAILQFKQKVTLIIHNY